MPFDNPYIPDINNLLSQHQRGLQVGTAMREQNTLSKAGELFSQGDRKGTVNALSQGGMLEKAVEMENIFRQTARQADADKLAKVKRTNEVIGNLAMSADTPEKWAIAIDTAKRAGLDVAKWEDFGTRDYVLAQGDKTKEMIDVELKRRALEAKGAGGVGKPPAGYRIKIDPNTGQPAPDSTGQAHLEAIPGGPATKMSAEQSGRIALMRGARGDLEAAKKFYQDMGVTGRIGHVFNSGEAGRAERTVSAAIEAVLRALTGAAATEAEVTRLEKLFAPDIYDTAETRADKLRKLEGFIDEAEKVLTQGRGGVPDATAPQGGEADDLSGLSDDDILRELGGQ